MLIPNLPVSPTKVFLHGEGRTAMIWSHSGMMPTAGRRFEYCDALQSPDPTSNDPD